MRPSKADSVARAAMLCAGAMIAHQIGAKSARDALFLSSFGVTALPAMLASSALASLVFVLVAAKALHRIGPASLLPMAFGISAVLQILEWVLVLRAPRWGAVAVYLHVATFGSVVISGFWSLLGERFDPRAAKRRVAWIAGAGTLGGLLGGLGTAALGRERGPESMLLPLAFLHLVCAWFARRVGSPEGPEKRDAEDGPREGSALRLLREGPYLRAIAMLVVTSSVGATLADYVFKAQASAHLDEAALLRFFAAFYTATGFLAFLTQLGLGRLCLERLGLSKTAATLPCALVTGGLSNIMLPGLASAAAFRGAEAVVRASLYRLGYELLYVPLSPSRKRGFKTLVDVGLERLGDLGGAGLVQLALVSAPQGALALLSALAAAAGVAGLWVVQRLERGYVRALEANLLSRGAAGAGQTLDAAVRSRAPTLPVPVLGAADPLDSGLFLLTLAPASPPEEAASSGPRPKPPPAAAPGPSLDPVVARLAELRSGDAERVRRTLRAGPLHELLLPQAISLLAWDEVLADAAEALRKFGGKATGQLADALLDPQREFAIRRRVPRVLGAFASQRAVDGLAQGLEDPRFEVRFACGRALADLRGANPGLELSQERIFAVVTREASIDRALWEGHRLLDWPESSEPGTLVEGLVRIRGGRGLEHVFVLLSLVLPREPVRVAYRALQTEDEAFRGTALEYLESVLPPGIRASLWPLLEDERPGVAVARRGEDVLDELMRSQSTIELSLGALRQAPRDAMSS